MDGLSGSDALESAGMTETASFGYWLRRRRKALDLTQEMLARRVGAAVVTIQKIEADERRPSRQLAELLADELVVPPEERAAFIAAARGERATTHLNLPNSPTEGPVPEPFGAQPPHNLPLPPTPFVGRAPELAETARLLGTTRLLTLTGPAGSGKTRLGLELARTVLPGFPDGVTFVPLAAVTDPAQVIPTIANALQVKTPDADAQTDALIGHLADRHVLLLLDNFEQVTAAAPAVAGLLVHLPYLCLLVTSREALRVRGEQEYSVPPLTRPDPRRREPIESLARYEAVELFVQRAQAARPDFVLTPENAAAVAEICSQLDGLPLALELAAARVRVFTPQGLLARFSRRLDLLVDGPRDLPDRQRSLHHAIRWSYDLLTVEEQVLLDRLAVFVNGWMMAAAEAVCAGDPLAQNAVLETLSSLVAKSLAQATVAGPETRFTLLETIREFARERLAERDETTALQNRHLDYYAALVAQAEPHFFDAEQAVWLDRLEAEHDNIHAALQWGLAAGDDTSAARTLRLVAGLGWFWHLRGYWSEGRTWAEAALRRGEALPGETRAGALLAVGILAWAQGDFAATRAGLTEGLRLLSTGESHPRAHALGLLGLVNLYEYRLDEAQSFFEESLALFRRLDDGFGVGVSLIRLAIVANQREAYERADALNDEALAIFRHLDNPWGIATALGNMGETALAQARWAEAATCYQEALITMRRTGSRWYESLLLVGVAGVAIGRGLDVEGAQLLGVGDALLRRMHGRRPQIDRQLYERCEAAALARLGNERYRTAWEKGHALSEADWLGIAEYVLSQ